MDIVHRVATFIDHNRYAVLMVVLAIAAAVALGSCASRTVGLDGVQEVDRSGLSRQVIASERTLAARRAELEAQLAQHNIAVEAHNRTIAGAVEDLDRQDALRAQLVDIAGGAIVKVASGAVDPAGLAVTAVSLLGVLGSVGLGLDNRRKDRVIDSHKESLANAL